MATGPMGELLVGHRAGEITPSRALLGTFEEVKMVFLAPRRIDLLSSNLPNHPNG
jgi:hypothetical protein